MSGVGGHVSTGHRWWMDVDRDVRAEAAKALDELEEFEIVRMVYGGNDALRICGMDVERAAELHATAREPDRWAADEAAHRSNRGKAER